MIKSIQNLTQKGEIIAIKLINFNLFITKAKHSLLSHFI